MNKILSMAALALIMAGCSNDDEKIVIDNGSEVANAVPVQIMQKVAGVETKAATNPIEVSANIIMVDAATGSKDAPNFGAFVPKDKNTLNDQNGFASETDRANVALSTFTASATATALTLSPKLYYPTSASTGTFIYGVAPQGTVSNGGVVTFSTVDGYQDVMFAGKQDAGVNTDATNKTVALDFAHQTSQLIFVAKLTTTEFSGTEWAGKTVSVDKIIIRDAEVPKSINLSDGNLQWEKMDIEVAGCKTKLTNSPCDNSKPAMIKPTTEVKVNIVLKLSDGTPVEYNGLSIKKASGTDNLAINKGESHLVTFEITPPKEATNKKVSVTAIVQNWTTGEPGKVEIK